MNEITHSSAGRAATAAPQRTPPGRNTRRPARHRPLALALLCLSVCVIVMDGTIVNIALPTLLRDLGGGTTIRQLQWIVDAYILVFAGLLMAASSLGDRFGRKPVLLIGLVLFAAFSAAAGRSADAPTLILWRAFMGIGAAFIFPATLAIIVNLYPEPALRKVAIGAWAAMSGLGVAIGPAAGGFILERWAWGWVFFINVPVCLLVALGVFLWVPPSRDPTARRVDVAGTVLCLVAVSALTFAIIEAPRVGWLAGETLGVAAGALGVFLLFLRWEARCAEPMIDLALFRRRTFAGGSYGIATAFFGLFGFVFLVSQYFQLVRGYGAFESGLRTLPFAAFTGITAPLAPALARRIGSRWVVSIGLALMALCCALSSTNGDRTAYWIIVLQMLPMGMGLGLVNATGADLIMQGLPREKAGIGSAVNDTARELGGTLGVAAMGSLFASLYSRTIGEKLAALPLPADALQLCRESVVAAAHVAHQAGALFGPAAEQTILSAISPAFLAGFHAAAWLGASFLGVGAAGCWLVLPARWED
jgi:EmrB/QacA subfamily drug resistance transporter